MRPDLHGLSYKVGEVAGALRAMLGEVARSATADGAKPPLKFDGLAELRFKSSEK